MAKGDIDDSIIDSYEFATVHGIFPNIIRVDADIHAIIYDGSSSGVFLITTDINADGTFTGSVIDSVGFTGAINAWGNGIANLPGTDWYVLTYSGPNGDGWARSYNISSQGTITGGTSTLEYDTVFGFWTQVYHISGNVFAVLYMGGSNNYATVKTFEMASDGTLGAVIDTKEIYTGEATRPHGMVNISGTVYAAVMQSDNNSNGWLITFTISAAGDIGNSTLDIFEFDGTQCIRPRIVTVGDNMVAIVYFGVNSFLNSALVLKTYPIDDNGIIGSKVDEDSILVTTRTNIADIINVKDNIYAIAFNDYDDVGDQSGWIQTMRIDADGDIGGVYDRLQYDTSSTSYPVLLHRADDAFIIAKHNPDNDGWLISVGIARYDNVFPTDAVTRVTNLVHRYNRKEGVYTLEMNLGEVTSDFGVPEWAIKPRTAVPKFPDFTDIPEPKFPRRQTVLGPGTPEEVRVQRRAGFFPGLEGERVSGGPSPVFPDRPRRLDRPAGFTEEREEIKKLRRKISMGWRSLTPWREEEGETFGSEIIERLRKLRNMRGVLGIIGDIFRRG